MNEIIELARTGLIAEHNGAVVLMGSKCRDCGEVFFPKTTVCAHCLSVALDDHSLGSKGRVWASTVQLFRPKEPFDGATGPDFVPFGVGYVELECGIKVESRLRLGPTQQLEVGCAVNLEIEPYHRNPDGSFRYTYCFGPESRS
ncbi:MAG TPA: zinc ribbon domain-containing protein [Vicinamibacterales bacterium]|nr:zinc ribbon domain-containing protein [Vicinamibacterales bacterium]